MIKIKRIKDWKKIRAKIKSNLSIGFVPTMGALHEGHCSLIQRSKQENDITVLSIFVNSTQFNEPDDYKNYPRNMESDLKLVEKFNVDYIFVPDEKEIYPEGNNIYFNTDHPLSKMFEGKHRPGHFNGVLTVVMKLFQLVRPTRAYFGEKDYQQYLLIKSMAENFFMPINICVCPTIREKSGLPLSSRNSRLSKDEKEPAELFF